MISVDEINRLQAENKRLNDIIDSYQPRLEELKELKAENERLKALFCKEQDLIKLIERTQDDYEKCILQKEHFEKRAKKAENCLQEIKEIAEKPKPFKDFSEIKTATEVGYDYAAICNELELRLHKVLELITKAESEG